MQFIVRCIPILIETFNGTKDLDGIGVTRDVNNKVVCAPLRDKLFVNTFN